MLKENKFVKEIQQLNQEKNEALWKRIEEEMEETPIMKVNFKNTFLKWSIAIASVTMATVIGVVGFISLFNNQDSIRYLTQADYQYKPTNITLKEYSDLNNKNWLYWNWYDTTDYLEDYYYALNDGGEIVCYNEFILDPNTGYVFEINVLDGQTQIEEFNSYAQSCVNNQVIQNVEVKYTILYEQNYAYFTYQDYSYYISTDMAVEEGYFISILEQLIP